MLTLFQHHRIVAARATQPPPPQDPAGRWGRGRHRLNEDAAEPMLLLSDHDELGQTTADQQQLTRVGPPLPVPVAPAPRQRTRRYRSRNCQNFKRYGEFFQYLDPSLYDENEEQAASPAVAVGAMTTATTTGLLRPRGRRSLRAYDRRLAEELRDMQRRVTELERQRDLLHSAMLNSHSNAITHAMGMIKQFYVLFANGYDPAKNPQLGRTAEAFMRAVMTEDVVCTEFKGVELFLSQYLVTSQTHASFKLALHDINVINDENDGIIQIKATATCIFRIKRETLESLFPPIIEDEELTQQLIGKEYVLQYDKVFHFQRGLVFQHESRVDFCNGILEMVQDPFVAMKLLKASVMTKHGHLKVDHRIEEDAHLLENSVL